MSTKRFIAVSILAGLAAASALAQSTEPKAAAPGSPNNPFDPPDCTGTVFADVTCSGLFDAWIEQYSVDGITGGCGGGNYCPNNPVTRGQMAVFVEKAMRGTASWSPGDRGLGNTALGDAALLSTTTNASGNTAIGSLALVSLSFNNGGVLWESGNTAIGSAALVGLAPTATSNGRFNTGVGYYALSSNVVGLDNTAVGTFSLAVNEGFRNTALGYDAGSRNDTIPGYAGSDVTLVANQSGNYNTFVGITGATAQVSNCTAVGIDAYCDANDQVRLGNVFVTSIGGKVDWSALSDVRAKSDVRDLDLGLPFVLALRPVAYRYKHGNGRTDLGFVAQDVEALLGDGYNVVDPGGDANRTLSLRYSELIAPLVKAVQEQQAQIDNQKREIEALETRLAEIDALRAEVSTLVRALGPAETIAAVRAGTSD